MVALGGVVVHHVEDHLDVSLVQGLHHRLELADLLAALPGRGIPVVRRQEPDRVVTPVVSQAPRDEGFLRDELVHGHELHRGDPEPLQVRDDGRVRKPGVGPALGRRDVRMTQGQPAHVGLVDDRLVVRDLRSPVAAPVEERVDHHVLRHPRRTVCGVPLRRIAELVVEQRVVPVDVPFDGLRVRVEQQLGAVAAPPARRIVGSVHAIAVTLARCDAGQVAVPDEVVDFGQLDLRFCERAAAAASLGALAGRIAIEQAQLHTLGNLREQGKVRTPSVPRRTERVRRSRPDTHSPPSCGKPGRVRPAADSPGLAKARRDV